MKVPLPVTLSFVLSLFAICSASYAETGRGYDLANPDHILGGQLISGEVWELKVYCGHAPDNRETLHGVLTVNGKKQNASRYGAVVKATLGDIVHFGDRGSSAGAVTGWYFSAWPKTCSFLPK